MATASAPGGSSISGAPTTQLPCSPNDAPLHLRADENAAATGDRPPRIARVGGGDRLHRGVRLFVGGRQRGERRASFLLAGAVEHQQLDDLHVILGQGARLVGTDDVDASEALDGRQLLHEAALAAETNHADGEGDARQEHEAFGDHRDDAGDGAADGVS